MSVRLPRVFAPLGHPPIARLWGALGIAALGDELFKGLARDIGHGGTRKGDTTALRNLKYRLQVVWQRWRYQSGDLDLVKFK